MNENQPPPLEQFFKGFVAEYSKAWDNDDLQAIPDKFPGSSGTIP